MAQPLLEVAGLNQFYAGSHTLWDVDLVVPRGACLCLMGRNGVGKTTLLNTIMGLVALRSGSVRFQGAPVESLAAEQRARLGIGYVPQGRMIFPLLSVEENLRIGLAARRDRAAEVPEQIYELFPVLKSMRNRRGGDLSGGQQQQLAIGRALALDPSLLILDEPTEGIQPSVVREIGDVIMALNRERGLTILLVEQKLPFARRVGDSFCILDKGRTVARGPMAGIDDDAVRAHLSI